MALTATANEQTKADIVERLGIKGCVMLTSSFNRRNLHYSIRDKKRSTIVADMATFIRSNHSGESGVIYCFSRANCEDVAKDLRTTHFLKAEHFHAGMTTQEKKRVQDAWTNGKCDIIVATVRRRALDRSITYSPRMIDCLRDGY